MLALKICRPAVKYLQVGRAAKENWSYVPCALPSAPLMVSTYRVRSIFICNKDYCISIQDMCLLMEDVNRLLSMSQ